jgi:serine/threonine-protein kinase mTOR
LVHLLTNTKRLIEPYFLPMLKALLPKAADPNAAVASNIIVCLGDLVVAGGEEALPHVPELMAVILHGLEDASVLKRDAAIITLGKVCASTSYVIEPLIEYPELVPLLGRILKAQIRVSVRREIIKAFGILGALDPYRRYVRFQFCLTKKASTCLMMITVEIH